MRDTPYGTALSALALAGFYVAAGDDDEEGAPSSASPSMPRLAIATVFLTLVIPFALDERSTAGAWTLEAAGLVWIGFRQQSRPAARLRLHLLFVLAGVSMLFAHERHGAPTLVFNAYLFNGLMAAAAALAGRVLHPSASRRCAR